MPNWCSNRVIVAGSERELDRFEEYVSTKDARFSLEKIIPMPEDVYRGNLGDKEREKYGEKNWYDWSVQNWGTKWEIDPKSITRDATSWEVQYKFETAWGPPYKIHKHLVNEFPQLDVKWYHRDEFEEKGQYLPLQDS